MRTVHKFTLPIRDVSHVTMPVTARILKIDHQRAGSPELSIWALVDTNFKQPESREFVITGTGHPLPHRDRHELTHRATVLADQFVWHVWQFVRIPERREGE